MNNNYKVAIIGAGMAGLGAALTLTENQIDYIILEAQDHPGGRIQTQKVADSVIDLGAQWVHGVDNDLYQILVDNDLVHTQTSDEGLGIYVRNDGLIIDEFLVKRVDFEVGRILEECENFVDCSNYPKSLGDFLENKFQHFLMTNCDNYNDEEKSIMADLFDWHVRFQLIDNSCGDLRHLSAKEWGRYSCLGKDGQKHINIKGGYGTLVDVLVKKLPSQCIEYNKPIWEVAMNDDGSVQIDAQDGSSFTADHVIITCSLGVLKSRKFTFPMGTQMKRTIADMGYGGMGKVFLEFEHRWWKPDGFQLIWERSTPPASNCQWLRHLSGFDGVLDQPNMLVGWVSQLGIVEMENSNCIDVGNQCTQLLRRFLKDDTVPYPIHVYKSSWFTNPFIKGSYSHTTPECDSSGPLPTATVLALPYCDKDFPRIFLAGEAVHESHFSTTHGAFESGQLQAQKLINFLLK